MSSSKKEQNKSLLIHSTSMVDEGAKIGENTKIWHWSHISSGAEIGSNCSLGQNVFIGNTSAVTAYCQINGENENKPIARSDPPRNNGV